ncbi:hypothetical protein [Bdellovibrio sp. HCB337]|uniref:hypothetical protein n=1 Tax=Bdellovibrio sp. HCB337 TaxID=3394358 RepID=UPI0039A49269
MLTLSLELEIKTLLEEFRDPEVVAEKLIKLFEDHPEDWSAESLQQLSRFLLSCGLYQVLISFCMKHITAKNFMMPWAYFVEALARGIPDLEEDIVKFIVMGIEEENAIEQACLAQGSERFIKKSTQWKNELKRKRRKASTQLKQRMFDELLTLRTQQLYEQEKTMLSKMQRMFPGDQDIVEEIRQHKERYALDILSRRAPLSRSHSIQEAPPSPEARAMAEALKHTLVKAGELYPDMAFDFAVAAYMMDEPQASLAILERLNLSVSETWFYLEVKLRCRHFLEVLNELNHLEVKLAHEPETFFATAYLRAQAYWGLAQKHVAIEILESILVSRPNYRAGSALLDMWRSQ